MQFLRGTHRAILLALSLLPGCAESDAATGGASPALTRGPSVGSFGYYLTGRFALSNGDEETGARDLLRALALNPGQPELTEEAFLACVVAGHPDAVRLARLLPDNQIAQLVLASDDVKSGNWRAAERRFLALPRQGMMQWLQPLLLAWARQGDGRTAEALATIKPLIESPRFRATAALHAAMIADMAGLTGDAGRFYQIARDGMQEPNARTARILSSWAARSGHPEEAQRILNGLVIAAPDIAIALPGLIAAADRRPVVSAADGVAEVYFTFASALRMREAADFAKIILRLSLDSRSDFASARLAASEIHAFQRRFPAALHVLDNIPASDPISPIIRLRRAALADRLGRGDEAVRELEALRQEFPRSPQPEILLGDLLRVKQRFPEAIAAYDRAIERIGRPGAADWGVFYNRGVALEQTRDWPRAEADFSHALELAPEQPLVLNYLGYAWTERGKNLDQAREMIVRAAATRPDDGAIADSLGWVLFRQGKVAEAVPVLERAVELEPEDPTINSHLGDVYWAVGRALEARFQWRRALNLNPPAEEIARLEAKLQSNTGLPPSAER